MAGPAALWSLAGIGGLGETQPLKPQIAPYRNAPVAALCRRARHRNFRPFRGHNGLVLIRT